MAQIQTQNKQINKRNEKLGEAPETETSVTIGDALGIMVGNALGKAPKKKILSIKFKAKIYYSNRTYTVMIPNKLARSLGLNYRETIMVTAKKLESEQPP